MKGVFYVAKDKVEETMQATYGKSVEDYCKEALAAVDMKSMLGDVADQYRYEGAYKVEGDKLYVVESADQAFGEYEIFRVEGDKLIIESPDGATGQLGAGLEYPLEMNRK